MTAPNPVRTAMRRLVYGTIVAAALALGGSTLAHSAVASADANLLATDTDSAHISTVDEPALDVSDQRRQAQNGHKTVRAHDFHIA